MTGRGCLMIAPDSEQGEHRRASRKPLGLAAAILLVTSFTFATVGLAAATFPGRNGRIVRRLHHRQIAGWNPTELDLDSSRTWAMVSSHPRPRGPLDGKHTAFASNMSGCGACGSWTTTAATCTKWRGTQGRWKTSHPCSLPTAPVCCIPVVGTSRPPAARCFRSDRWQRQAGPHAGPLRCRRLQPVVPADGTKTPSPASSRTELPPDPADGGRRLGVHAVTPVLAPGRTGPLDGRTITFSSNCCRLLSNVYVMDLDGDGIQQPTSRLQAVRATTSSPRTRPLTEF